MRGLAALTVSLSLGAAPAFAEPLKIALVEAFSGPGGASGLQYRDGFRYGIQRFNESGGFRGEPVVAAEYDNQSTTGGATDKLRAAIADGARIIVQGGSSAIQGQILEDIRKYNLRNPGKEVVFVAVGGESYELTAAKCSFWYFHYSTNSPIRFNALLPVMRERGALGKRVYTINQNYGYGRESQDAEAEVSKRLGSTVAGSVLHDMDKIQDFSPYIARIKESGADTVLTGNWGNDLILLMKSANEAALPVTFGATNLDNPGVLASAGRAALGSYHASTYSPEAGGEAGAAFARDYKAKFGQYPLNTGYGATFGMQLVGEALRAIPNSGKPLDATTLAQALEGATSMTPLGAVSMRRQDHQAVQPVAVSIVAKDAKYPAEGSDMGLKLVQVVPGPQAVVPADPACRMDRPS